ncbi:hypothetical protein H5T58_02855 [Candidatus Parcubacteria bacterium]|nr:hypothetical protein [Candidatus Parcubacteria bacterium]
MKIIGHQFQLQYLLSQIQQKKLPHFFLFSGPEKVGKKTIAIFLSNTLLPNFSPSHPDFLMIKPEKDKISIDQIKQAIWFLSLKPSLGDYKIVIVDDAHLMTKDAQNCFLKTLEEPKGKTLIFLVSSLPSLLLSTIHSRAHKLKFTFVSKE